MAFRIVALPAALVLLALGCGDRQPTPAAPTPVVADAGPGITPTPGDAGAAKSLSQSECNAFVDHVVELGMRKLRSTTEEGKPLPTEAQLEDIRKRLSGELMAGCLALDRTTYECAMGATDAAAYAGCDAR